MEGLSTVYCSLGSNLGDRESYLKEAINRISNEVGNITAQSSIYETPPLGFEASENFLNMCVSFQTRLSPLELMNLLKKIENDLGRIKTNSGKYESRNIDIDIIFYGGTILNTKDLTIPHPLFRKRKFVLLPLRDIDKNYTDPISHLTIDQILLNCKDKSIISIFKKYNSGHD